MANYVVSTYVVPHLRRLLPVPVYIEAKRANSWERCWSCVPVAGLPWSGSPVPPSYWNSEAKRLAEAQEPQRYPKKRAWTVWKLTEGGAWRHWSWRQSEDNYSNEQRSASPNKELGGCLFGMGWFWRKRRVFVSPDLRCFISSSQFQGLVHRHL